VCALRVARNRHQFGYDCNHWGIDAVSAFNRAWALLILTIDVSSASAQQPARVGSAKLDHVFTDLDRFVQ
jgi:hypothetical protein